MSGPDLAFGFAQARMQARFGRQAEPALWRQLDATQDLGAVLQLLRGSALAHWTSRLGAAPDVHEIERGLRDEWLRVVDEVTEWQPDRWRAATHWIRWTVYLPSLQKLARGGHAPAWMRADPVLGPLVAQDPRERRPAIARTLLAPLSGMAAESPDVARAWARHWQSLWPPGRPAQLPLDRLLRAGFQQRATIADAPAGATSRDSLQMLAARLRAAFRRHPLSPTAVVSYLALLAFEMLQLRGILAVRALRERAVAGE